MLGMSKKAVAGCGCCSAIFAIPFVLAAMVFWPSRTPPPPVTSPQVATSVGELRKSVKVLIKDMEANRSVPFSLKFTNDEVNYILHNEKPVQNILSGAKLDSGWIEFEEGYAVLSIIRPMVLAGVTATVELKPTLVDGQIKLQSTGAKLGHMSMPAGAVEELTGRIEKIISERITTTTLQLKSMECHQGFLRVDGLTAPSQGDQKTDTR